MAGLSALMGNKWNNQIPAPGTFPFIPKLSSSRAISVPEDLIQMKRFLFYIYMCFQKQNATEELKENGNYLNPNPQTQWHTFPNI